MAPGTSPPTHLRHRWSTFATATSLAALALLAAACGGETPGAKAVAIADTGPGDLTPIRFGIPWTGAAGTTPTDIGPVGYADSLGLAEPIFAEHGFDLTDTVAFNNGPPTIEALQGGSVELVQVGDTPGVSARASGRDNRVILVNEPALDAWFLSRPGGPSDLADFAGRKVGLQFGSNFDKYGRAVLAEAGVIDDVELVNLPFTDALPALQRGDIDGYAVIGNLGGIWTKNDPELEVLHKASEDDRSLLGTSVVLAAPAFLDAHPGIQEAWWEVYEKGAAEIEADHDAYFAWISAANGTPVDVVEQTTLLEFADEPLAANGITALERGLEFLVDIGTVEQPFDIDAWLVEP